MQGTQNDEYDFTEKSLLESLKMKTCTITEVDTEESRDV
jgi:hypothetical protein